MSWYEESSKIKDEILIFGSQYEGRDLQHVRFFELRMHLKEKLEKEKMEKEKLEDKELPKERGEDE